MDGVVKAVKSGFGFIRARAGGPEVFFHHSVVRGRFDALLPGDTVVYELDDSPIRGRTKGKGPRASSVRRVS